MVTVELRYECITCRFLIDECWITNLFRGYIVNFVKHVRSMSPDIMLVDEELYAVQAWKKLLSIGVERPESSVISIAHHRVQALNSADYVLRLPVGSTSMCAAAGHCSSCAEQL
ncbi:hypothetical protein TNCV_4923771 [Trichonephila clavipes]|nr:hypothetical protein TNCV_4923771 [Trichonephila clavipes]